MDQTKEKQFQAQKGPVKGIHQNKESSLKDNSDAERDENLGDLEMHSYQVNKNDAKIIPL